MRLKASHVVVASWIAVAAPSCATAGEFANIIDPQNPRTEQASRQASARALQSIQKIFEALEKSELGQLAARRETLDVAVSLLSTASQQMQEVDIKNLEVVPVNYAALQPTERISLQRYFEVAFRRELPKSIGELYSAFRESTNRLAARLSEASKSNAPLLPSFDAELTAYLSFGFTLSKAARL
ncbi:MAG TPA: hypothetical protein VGC77_22580 [Rhodopseudomonas sp.]|uniref:hypothetical protein n=1 Tax=Rhodopseudomonas sp. TaxID=1078 RepID=UPI002ED7E13B